MESNTGLKNWTRADREETNQSLLQNTSSSNEPLRNGGCWAINYALLFWETYFEIMLYMQRDLTSFLRGNLFKNRFAYILRHISCNSLFPSDSMGIVSSPHHYRTQNHNFLKGCVIQNLMLYDKKGKCALRIWGVVSHLCKTSEAKDEGSLMPARLFDCSIFQSTLKPAAEKHLYNFINILSHPSAIMSIFWKVSHKV